MTWKDVFYSGRMPVVTDIGRVAELASQAYYRFFSYDNEIYFVDAPGRYYKTGLKVSSLDGVEEKP